MLACFWLKSAPGEHLNDSYPPGGPTIPPKIGNHIVIGECYPCIACGGRHDEVVGSFQVKKVLECAVLACFWLKSAPEEHLNDSNPPPGDPQSPNISETTLILMHAIRALHVVGDTTRLLAHFK